VDLKPLLIQLIDYCAWIISLAGGSDKGNLGLIETTDVVKHRLFGKVISVKGDCQISVQTDIIIFLVM